MSIEISFSPKNELEVDAAGLTPAINAGCDPEELQASRVLLGVRLIEAGELFSFGKSTVKDCELTLRGDWSRVRNVAAGLAKNRIRVDSSVGVGAGRMMFGGKLNVVGNAGHDLGQGMTGGLINVEGDAGDRVAGPVPGRQLGANRGTVFVGGSAGSHAAMGMRRGNLVINGACGDLAGYEMRGGNLVVGGRAGGFVGCGMRRGLIVLLQGPAAIAPGFQNCGRFSPSFAGLLWRELISLGWKVAPIQPDSFEVWAGERLYGNKAEVMVSTGAGLS